MSVTLDVTGVPDVTAALRRAGQRAEAAAQRVVSRYVDLIEREAKGFAPVDTGDLRANIRGRLERLAGEVLSDLPYSAAVELGRADIPAYPIQPYLAPAFEMHRAGFVRDLRSAVSQAMGAS